MIYALITAAVLAICFIVFRTNRLNEDPRQQKLAEKMLFVVEEHRQGRAIPGSRVIGRMGPDGSHVRVGPRPLEFAWREEVVPFFVGLYGTLPYGQRQNRAAHALSMIRSRLTTDEYEELRTVWCQTLPNYDDENWRPSSSSA